eukprot:gene6561-7513_t
MDDSNELDHHPADPGNFDDDVGADDALEVIEVNVGDMDMNDDNDDDADADDDDDGGPATIDDNSTEEEPKTVNANASSIFENHTGPVFTVAVSPDSQLAVSGSQDDTAVLFKIDDGSILQTFDGHHDSIISLDFSSDGSYLALGCMDGSISVWTQDLEKNLDLDLGDDLTWLAFHPTIPFLLAASASGAIIMWAVPSGTMFNFFGHQDAVSCGKWLPNGRAFVSAGDDGKMLAWSPKSREITARFDGKVHLFHNCPVSAIACHEDNVIVATGGVDGSICLCNIKTGKVIMRLPGHDDTIEALEFSNSQPTMLASGCIGGNVQIYNLSTKLQISSMRHEAAIVKLQWHPRLPVLYSCSADTTLSIWDTRDGSQLHTCHGHTDTVLDFVAFSDGFKVLTCGDDQKVMLFEIPSLPEI